MPATLDLGHVKRLADSFPNDDWQVISTCDLCRSPNGQLDWRSARHLECVGGVYAILLPTAWFSASAIVHLHGPKGVSIPFEFTLPDFTGDGQGIAYVGRTTNLRQRWSGHLSKGERKDGGQVKFGLEDCGLYADETTALRKLREHARIVYTVLDGPMQCANRDLLEISLCARFAPPFNIKSER